MIISDGSDMTPLAQSAKGDLRTTTFKRARAKEGFDALRLSEALAYAIAASGGSERVNTFSLKRFSDATLTEDHALILA